jgi:hypothetical protein
MPDISNAGDDTWREPHISSAWQRRQPTLTRFAGDGPYSPPVQNAAYDIRPLSPTIYLPRLTSPPKKPQHRRPTYGDRHHATSPHRQNSTLASDIEIHSALLNRAKQRLPPLPTGFRTAPVDAKKLKRLERLERLEKHEKHRVHFSIASQCAVQGATLVV